MRADLRRVTLDELTRFVFDHPDPGPTPPDGGPDWFWADRALEVDDALLLTRVAELFADARALRDRFTPGQIEQGLWFLVGPAGDDWFGDALRNPRVPWPTRAAVIESAEELYAQLFEFVDTDTIGFMFWDLLLDQFRSLEGETLRLPAEVKDAAIPVLGRLLARASTVTRQAALHGLGHLKDPRAAAVAQRWLDGGPDIARDLKDYALRVARQEQTSTLHGA